MLLFGGINILTLFCSFGLTQKLFFYGKTFQSLSQVLLSISSTTTSKLPPSAVDDESVHFKYATVSGLFLQDLTSTNQTSFDYTAVNFGLINQTYKCNQRHTAHLSQWQKFKTYVEYLNNESPNAIKYKVLFIGRHGEGYHNAAESYYGTPSWNCYYAELDGNGTASWSDAALTPAGVAQAIVANSFWSKQILTQKIQVPQTYYVSPLSRCLETANYTFSNLSLPKYYPFIPAIKEFLREGISIHTCDRRSNRADIRKNYPNWIIEESFTENDELWNGITAESPKAQQYRSKLVLDDIFSSDSSIFISITTHSGEAGALLAILGHIPFSLSPGAVLPMLIRASTVSVKPTATSTADWVSSSWCTNGPPKTSEATSPYGCKCSNGDAPIATTIRII